MKIIYIHMKIDLPIVLGGGTNIDPYWLPPSPSLASSKVSCQGQGPLKKQTRA